MLSSVSSATKKGYRSVALDKDIHGYHLVEPSPWPILAAFSAFVFTFGFVLFVHKYTTGIIWQVGLLMLMFVLYHWWRDVIREATIEGWHTKQVQEGIQGGFILFIASEVMFFVGFFWSFFYGSFSPDPSIGGVWPPRYLVTLDEWHIPLLNSCILLTSGATITYAHNALHEGKKKETVIYLVLTIILALIFTVFQYFEYFSANFEIADGIYGSSFFMATGFHGFHVIIGTSYLIVCLYRLIQNQFTRDQFLGFDTAAWYWHFVDVVWLYLFVVVYWWGS